MINFYTAFGLSFVLGFIFSFLVKKIYEAKKWLDIPEKTKHKKVIHKKAVPRGGGVAIFLTVCILSFIFLPIDKYLIGIFAGALVLTIIGFLDDLYNLHPLLRLGMGFLAAAIVVASGIGIAYISNPFGEGVIHLNQPQIPIFLLGKMRTIWIISDIFALVWIVGVMNFVNWSKGLDGQLPGMVTVASITIALLSQRFSTDITQWETGVLALIIGGAYLGFLMWNKFPQKMMPGYGGGALAGYFLAVLAILSTTKVGTLMVVLGVPLIDAVLVMIRRVIAGKSPIWGDTRHLHHALLKMGWSKQRVAHFYWLMTAILGIIALKLNSTQKLYTIVLLILVLAAFLLWWKRSKTS